MWDLGLDSQEAPNIIFLILVVCYPKHLSKQSQMLFLSITLQLLHLHLITITLVITLTLQLSLDRPGNF